MHLQLVLTVSLCHSQHGGILTQRWLSTDTQAGEEQTSGSTATIVLARNDKVVVANVGDSRAVLCRSGQCQDLSTEHRYKLMPPA